MYIRHCKIYIVRADESPFTSEKHKQHTHLHTDANAKRLKKWTNARVGSSYSGFDCNTINRPEGERSHSYESEWDGKTNETVRKQSIEQRKCVLRSKCAARNAMNIIITDMHIEILYRYKKWVLSLMSLAGCAYKNTDRRHTACMCMTSNRSGVLCCYCCCCLHKLNRIMYVYANSRFLSRKNFDILLAAHINAAAIVCFIWFSVVFCFTPFDIDVVDYCLTHTYS